jgi:hypothetical protein
MESHVSLAIPVLTGSGDPGAILDAERRPWDSIARHMKDSTVSPLYFGFAYVAMGEARSWSDSRRGVSREAV